MAAEALHGLIELVTGGEPGDVLAESRVDPLR